MSYEAQKVGTVKELGEIYRTDDPLDEQLKSFARVGITNLATPEEVAQIRLAGITENWSRTSVAPIAIKGGKTILLRSSPIMNPLMAASAVKAHRNAQYLQLGKEFYEVADEIAKSQFEMAPEDREAIALSQTGDFPLIVEMDETRFLLGKTARPYFEKFVSGGKEGKIQFYNLEGDSKSSATVNYLWFFDPRYESSLDARSRYLYGNRAFGVLRTGAASAQKNGYSLTEIGNANSEVVPVVLRKAGVSALEGMLARPLTTALLEELRTK